MSMAVLLFSILLLSSVAFVCAAIVIEHIKQHREGQVRENSTRPAPFGRLSLGLVELSGLVAVDETPLTSPLRGDPCVQFSLLLETWDPARETWLRGTEIHDGVPYVIRAGFRRVRIAQNLDAWPPLRSSVQQMDVLPDVLARRLRYVAEDEAGVDVPAAFRLTETSLAEGDQVFVTLRVYELQPPRYDVVRVSPERAVEATWPFYLHPAAVLGVLSLACVCWLIVNLLSRVSVIW